MSVVSRRRVWSELVDVETLSRTRVLAPLAQRGIELMVAVTPDLLPKTPRVVNRCREAGVRVGLWPMLDDSEGRWPRAGNAESFVRLTTRLVGSLEAAGALPAFSARASLTFVKGNCRTALE